MRVFVAIPTPPSLQSEIRSWAARHGDLPVRWLKDHNLHITLVPPWEEKPAGMQEILTHLTEAVGTARKPLSLSFSQVRFGPDPRQPRLVWAEGETPPELAALSAALHQALGIEAERHPFRLHLTLARFRPEDFASFPVRELNEAVTWRMAVPKIVLMESHLLRGGAEYEVRGEIPLATG